MNLHRMQMKHLIKCQKDLNGNFRIDSCSKIRKIKILLDFLTQILYLM